MFPFRGFGAPRFCNGERRRTHMQGRWWACGHQPDDPRCGSGELPPEMEWPSPQPVCASNGPTLSCQGATAGAVQWSWPLKLVDGGRRKPGVSCAHSPDSAPGQSHHSCAREWNRHGGCGGGPYHALRLVLWPRLWWTLGEALGLIDGGLPAAHEVEAEQAFAGLV